VVDEIYRGRLTTAKALHAALSVLAEIRRYGCPNGSR
jgi:hypothetical protein